MIKYLVISGGDISFFSMLGTIKELIKKKDFFDINKLEKIYGTSAGSMIGFLLSLKLDYQIIIDYFINRPWEKLLKFNSSDLLNLYNSKGLIDKELFYEVYLPLLKSCSFDENVTLLELFNYSNIELNIYATKMNDISLRCFNHIETPNLKVLDALFMSSSLPILFKPNKFEDCFYTDGGFNCQFPIDFCYNENKDKSKILGIHSVSKKKSTIEFNDDDNILYFYSKLLIKIINSQRIKYENNVNDKSINKIFVYSDWFTIEDFIDTINKKETRKNLIEKGLHAAKVFLDYKS